MRHGYVGRVAEIGTVAAVLPLTDALKRFDGDRTFARAGEHAIAQIQSRLAGADAGRLTLTGAQTGEVSLAQTGGAVSLPSKEKTRRPAKKARAPRKPAAKRKRS